MCVVSVVVVVACFRFVSSALFARLFCVCLFVVAFCMLCFSYT